MIIQIERDAPIGITQCLFYVLVLLWRNKDAIMTVAVIAAHILYQCNDIRSYMGIVMRHPDKYREQV